MKSIFLSVVIICALAISGIGGTLATWSDSETSHDNVIETGSLDLKVNNEDDLPWGNGVPQKVAITCMIPDKLYGPFLVELWNAGECNWPSKAFIHIKDYCCYNVPPKLRDDGSSTGYLDPVTDPDYVPRGSMYKTEPELVAEYGGKVNCVEVPGIGPEGDDCSFESHLLVIITDTPTPPDEEDPTRTVDVRGLLGKLYCEEIYLFDLQPCQPDEIYLWFILQQDSEEDWYYDFIPDPDEDFDPEEDPAAYQHWLKFNDWPSWALMADGLTFDLEFDLWLDTSEVEEPIPPNPDDDPWGPPAECEDLNDD
jgi:predicted ribosomally synthesized peptide with SipW-like signal peptide